MLIDRLARDGLAPPRKRRTTLMHGRYVSLSTSREGTMPTTAVKLSGLELFEACTDEDLAGLTRAVTGVRRVAEGEVVCAEDEVADRWWIVVEGQADATWRGLYLGTILAGETIGELALLDGKPHTATVTATTDMVLQEPEGEGFVAALL